MPDVKQLSSEEKQKIYRGVCLCGGELAQGFFDFQDKETGHRKGKVGLICCKCNQIFYTSK